MSRTGEPGTVSTRSILSPAMHTPLRSDELADDSIAVRSAPNQPTSNNFSDSCKSLTKPWSGHSAPPAPPPTLPSLNSVERDDKIPSAGVDIKTTNSEKANDINMKGVDCVDQSNPLLKALVGLVTMAAIAAIRMDKNIVFEEQIGAASKAMDDASNTNKDSAPLLEVLQSRKKIAENRLKSSVKKEKQAKNHRDEQAWKFHSELKIVVLSLMRSKEMREESASVMKKVEGVHEKVDQALSMTKSSQRQAQIIEDNLGRKFDVLMRQTENLTQTAMALHKKCQDLETEQQTLRGELKGARKMMLLLKQPNSQGSSKADVVAYRQTTFEDDFTRMRLQLNDLQESHWRMDGIIQANKSHTSALQTVQAEFEKVTTAKCENFEKALTKTQSELDSTQNGISDKDEPMNQVTAEIIKLEKIIVNRYAKIERDVMTQSQRLDLHEGLIGEEGTVPRRIQAISDKTTEEINQLGSGRVELEELLTNRYGELENKVMIAREQIEKKIENLGVRMVNFEENFSATKTSAGPSAIDRLEPESGIIMTPFGDEEGEDATTLLAKFCKPHGKKESSAMTNSSVHSEASQAFAHREGLEIGTQKRSEKHFVVKRGKRKHSDRSNHFVERNSQGRGDDVSVTRKKSRK